MSGLAVWQYVGEEVKGQCYLRDSWQMPRVPRALHRTPDIGTPFLLQVYSDIFYNHTT
jgi:hypothetical protein